MKVYSFPRGGLSFDDPSVPPRDSSEVAYLPAISVIPLTQHPAGTVAPLVKAGDTVREGMLIGTSDEPDLANVHATVPGKVVRIASWNDHDGRANEAVVIRMEGAFERLGRAEASQLPEKLNFSELQRILDECGIVEMEGSGKPVAGILSALHDEKHTLVVRCVFDDPWLAADYVLCKNRLQAIVEGSLIIAKASGNVSRIAFAVSVHEKEIGEAMFLEAAQFNIPLSVVVTGSKYPQRNRRELELALRNYERKEKIEFGPLLIFGPATLAAVHDAVKYRRPILDRYVAVGGSAVRKPQVMKVRLGKRIGDLFQECGGFTGTPSRFAAGSPLSGKTIVDLDEPVTKTSYAVFAMLKTQAGDYPQRNCISCGECRIVCPVGLDPEALYKHITIKQNDTDMPIQTGCHGCGCCEVVCPSHLPLSDVIMGKRKGELNA